MEKQEFLRLFNECLKDGSIRFCAEHSDAGTNYDNWRTTDITIEVKTNEDPPVQFHNFKGS